MPVSSPPTASLAGTVRKTVLENGLTVLTKEVPTAPVVSVQIWYRVGSADESPGLNGISHQLEHLMFKGTKARPIQFGRLFNALGSDSNAFTSYDQTAYFNTAGREHLQTLLLLEADRLENLQFSQEDLAREKTVVISELEGDRNSPSSRLNDAVMRAAFPQHSYGLPIGGTPADVQRFTLEQIQQYYRDRYRPDNAVLIVVGDFETAPTLQFIEQAFGRIANPTAVETTEATGAIAPSSIKASSSTKTAPSLSPVSSSKQPIQTPAESQPTIVLKEPGSTALLQAVYPLPPANHADVPALQVLDYLLTGGRSARLHQALVETGLASDVWGYASNLQEAGWCKLVVTAAPGKSLEAISDAFEAAIANLRAEPPTAAELQRAKQQIAAGVILDHQDATSQAMLLGDGETTAGDYRFSDRYLAAVAQVTAADVQRVAQQYFTPKRAVVGWFQPTKSAPVSAGANASHPGNAHGHGGRMSQSATDTANAIAYLPQVDSQVAATASRRTALPTQLTLANGLRVLLLPDSSLPSVTLSGFIAAGNARDPQGKEGLADLTAESLMNGSQQRSALQLAQLLEDRGAELEFESIREGVLVEGDSLSTDFPLLLQVLAEVLQQATFPDDELDRSRQQAIAQLRIALDDPDYLAQRTLQQTLYPANHPFHPFPSEASLKAIRRQDLADFYRTHYRPQSTTLVVMGDFQLDQAKSLIQAQFGAWSAAESVPTIAAPPPVSPPQTTRQQYAALPGKFQSVTYLGTPGISRQDPRYYAAYVLNHILGGDTLASRLGMQVRDRKGLTYGIYSYFNAGLTPGPFQIEMQTAPENVSTAIAETLTLLKQLRDRGVTEAEVAQAKRSITNYYPVSLADPQRQARHLLLNQIYGLDRDEIHQFPAKIAAVTQAEIEQVAQDFIDPNRFAIVTVGPPLRKASSSGFANQ